MKSKNLLLFDLFLSLYLLNSLNPFSVMTFVKAMVWRIDLESIESHIGSKLDSMGIKGDQTFMR